MVLTHPHADCLECSHVTPAVKSGFLLLRSCRFATVMNCKHLICGPCEKVVRCPKGVTSYRLGRIAVDTRPFRIFTTCTPEFQLIYIFGICSFFPVCFLFFNRSPPSKCWAHTEALLICTVNEWYRTSLPVLAPRPFVCFLWNGPIQFYCKKTFLLLLYCCWIVNYLNVLNANLFSRISPSRISSWVS